MVLFVFVFFQALVTFWYQAAIFQVRSQELVWGPCWGASGGVIGKAFLGGLQAEGNSWLVIGMY